MKKNIHPENYRTVLFYDAGVKKGWLIKSCASTNTTMKWEDNKEYPLYNLDTSCASHPAYTGKTRQIENKGRVGKFMQKYGNLAKIKTNNTNTNDISNN